jgi:hypothetical protein
MFRFMQITALMAIALFVANESEAKSTSGASKGKSGTAVNKTSPAPTKAPVHGTGSSHDPKGPTRSPVHGTGSSHDPKGPTKTHPRDYHNWSHRYWNSRFGCEYCWSGVYGCYFYFYAPAGCYYPVTCIDQFPPVATTAVAPAVAAPVAPVAVVPAIQILNTNTNTLVNR